ncbi:hypothetical protein Pla52o_11220 [Novipirellula galeiformis]|uniref:Uncharacterized protein n=1 Tax=Novipirellula galeiformis TaxID=2528004 RepID=A0A5C6CKA1_9BACT|nr:hypothetical protein Pla52o_11220 [Novipirellula galeiformis]
MAALMRECFTGRFAGLRGQCICSSQIERPVFCIPGSQYQENFQAKPAASL